MSRGRGVQGGPARVLPTKGLRRRRADRGADDTPAALRVEAIEGMDREPLLALWASTMRGEPPSRLSQPFLRRILSFELQAREQGGLPAAAVRKLESLAAAQVSSKEKASAALRLKPGGRLLREWGGVTHMVDVAEGGFLWRGERHRSLSAIARAITGAHWSGPRFFGLQDGASSSDAKGKNASRADGKTPAAKQTSARAQSAAAKAASPGPSRRVA